MKNKNALYFYCNMSKKSKNSSAPMIGKFKEKYYFNLHKKVIKQISKIIKGIVLLFEKKVLYCKHKTLFLNKF